MTTPEGNQSDIAYVRAQIAAEQESAQRAMTSPAYGTASHLFITRRMERMGTLHEALRTMVGENEAAQILSEALEGQEPKGEK